MQDGSSPQSGGYRDILDEIAARRMDIRSLAAEAGVPVVRVEYWVALARLRRAQTTSEEASL